MRSNKARVLDWLDRQDFTEESIGFEELLITGVQTALQFDGIGAEAFVAGNIPRFWNYVLEKNDRDQSRGITPLLQVADSNIYRLRWVPSTLLRSSERRERRRGQMLRTRPHVLQTIDALNHREYEALGCAISVMMGATRTYLTPPNNEGGVDFFALLPRPGRSHLFSGLTGPLRIVGQAKRYETPVEVGEVRDFITALDNVRKRQPSVERVVPSWLRSSRGPLVGLIVAHRGLQSGGEDMARDHGIITADSLDLAEIAALARSSGEERRPEERARTVRDLVLAALEANGG